jgi:hypothetical protein
MKDLLDSVGAGSVGIHTLFSSSGVTALWLGFCQTPYISLGAISSAVKASEGVLSRKGVKEVCCLNMDVTDL